METWKTTITELIGNFRGGLNSILPWIEKSHVPYNESSSYDDWDNIVKVLFDSMIVASIQYSNEIESKTLNFAKYDLSYDNYHGQDFIIINNSDEYKHIWAFVSFVPEKNFDKVRVKKVDKLSLKVLNEELIEYSDCRFYFYKSGMVFESFEVQL